MERRDDDRTRVLLYSHDSQGLGHSRRNLALAHALAAQLPALTGRPVAGLVVSGLDAPAGQLPDGFDRISLPGIRKGSNGYTARSLDVSLDLVRRTRQEILTATVSAFAPDLVVVDRHVFGVNGELRSALERLRAEKPTARIVLGLREVLDEPSVVAEEFARCGTVAEIRALIDEIWVYGDPRVHDVRSSGELPEGLRDLVRPTGFLSTGRRFVPGEPDVDRPFVLTMVGGGGDGADLCRAAAAAAVPRGHRHLVVTGPQMSEAARREVQRAAGPRTTVVERVPDGLTTIREAAALICMGGYNTVSEVLGTPVPALVVPRTRPRREQEIRATAVGRTGAIDMLDPRRVDSAVLSGWLTTAVAPAARQRVTRARAELDLRGLAVVPRLAADLLSDIDQFAAPAIRGVQSVAV